MRLDERLNSNRSVSVTGPLDIAMGRAPVFVHEEGSASRSATAAQSSSVPDCKCGHPREKPFDNVLYCFLMLPMKAFQDITKPPWTQPRMLAATMLAVTMLAEGHPIAKVATELGLSPATARRYQAIYAVCGRDGLLPLGDVGRQHLLDRESSTGSRVPSSTLQDCMNSKETHGRVKT